MAKTEKKETPKPKKADTVSKKDVIAALRSAGEHDLPCAYHDRGVWEVRMRGRKAGLQEAEEIINNL